MKFYYHFTFSGGTVYVTDAEYPWKQVFENRVKNEEIESHELMALLNEGYLHKIQDATKPDSPAIYSDENPTPYELLQRLESHLPQLQEYTLKIPQHIKRTGNVSMYRAEIDNLLELVDAVKALKDCLKAYYQKAIDQWQCRKKKERDGLYRSVLKGYTTALTSLHRYDGDIRAAEATLQYCEQKQHESDYLQLRSLFTIRPNPLLALQLQQMRPQLYGVAA